MEGLNMPAQEIKPGIFWVGLNDRTTDLFEGLWPITQEGVSYNSYLVKDEKTAVIDLAKSIKADEFLTQIAEIADISKIDYIIVNHMEPDHTGLLRIFRQIAPGAVILGSAKTKEMLKGFFSIQDRVRAVGDGETLSLGQKTLKFFSTPFLHWPETIMTYETSHRILFSCDAFGGYGALKGAIFDDECTDHGFYEREALRYYANIVANYSARVLQAITALAGVPVDIVAPSHGLIWRREPKRIIELYKKWAEFASGKAEPGITLVYGSMYGHTERMMNAVAQGISRAGATLEIFDAARTHASYILPSLWSKTGVVVGAPTYEVRLFPPVAQVLSLAVHKRILNRKAAYFGSYGWSGGALKDVQRIVEPAKWEWTDSLEFVGSPTAEFLKKGEEFGRRFGDAVISGQDEKKG
jgi:anaerobic nitric oxide reductase flavorubredoxin